MTELQKAALRVDGAIDYLKREKWGYRPHTFVIVVLPREDADAVAILLSCLTMMVQGG